MIWKLNQQNPKLGNDKPPWYPNRKRSHNYTNIILSFGLLLLFSLNINLDQLPDYSKKKKIEHTNPTATINEDEEKIGIRKINGKNRKNPPNFFITSGVVIGRK